MDGRKEPKVDNFLNKRGPKTFILTFVLFIVSLSSYYVDKALEIGGWAIPTGIVIVWTILYFTRVDVIIFK